MKAKEMRDLSGEELRHKIDELSVELLNLRIQSSTGRLKNSSRIYFLKKDIARAKTILRARRDTEGSPSLGVKTS